MKLGFNIISVWFGFIMVLVLLTAACVFAFTDYMSDTLFGQKRLFFVILLVAYSIYRSIRIYQVLKQNRDEV